MARHDSAHTLRDQGLLPVVQHCCPLLEELVLGWCSEFEGKQQGPLSATEFARPFWCRPQILPGALPSLRLLAIPGYVGFATDSLLALGTLPLVTLDLRSMQLASDEVFAAVLAKLASTLAHLDVRGTHFGDESAHALAEARCNLARLNASCTELTGRGLHS